MPYRLSYHSRGDSLVFLILSTATLLPGEREASADLELLGEEEPVDPARLHADAQRRAHCPASCWN